MLPTNRPYRNVTSDRESSARREIHYLGHASNKICHCHCHNDIPVAGFDLRLSGLQLPQHTAGIAQLNDNFVPPTKIQKGKEILNWPWTSMRK
ncbi:hypothetical protein RRG08_051101 [Elysia crispata]|uniref:Uncharacterized protein n=1 Tax=Elysia crispata TaxID=231223 RepID=A0AAE1DZ27_9GAST|nr:hypothetical protein RRG08_051101 [Elysia crispata]